MRWLLWCFCLLAESYETINHWPLRITWRPFSGGHPKNDLCGRKYSHKELPKNFSGRFGEIWANIFRIPKNFACICAGSGSEFLNSVQSKSKPEVVGVTFSDSDSTPVPKFFNPGPGILQIWESYSFSDSGYNHWSNRNLPMFLLKKWSHILLLLLKWKSDSESGSVFTNFWLRTRSGSERKTQNPAGVDPGTLELVPLLVQVRDERTVIFCSPGPVLNFL